MDVTPEAVTEMLKTHQVTVLLHGHTHRPTIHDLEMNGQAAKRIVLGDWQEETGSAVIGIADETGIHLENYSF